MNIYNSYIDETNYKMWNSLLFGRHHKGYCAILFQLLIKEANLDIMAAFNISEVILKLNDISLITFNSFFVPSLKRL